MQKIKFTKTEMVEKNNQKIRRYPNLNTVLMVEEVLKNMNESVITIA